MSIGDSPGNEAAEQRPQPLAPRNPRRIPVRGSTLLALMALSVTAAGAVYLRGQTGVTIVTTTRDLAAYHRIEQSDVVETSIAKSSLPADYESDVDAVIGKYTTAFVEKSDLIKEGQLGPRLDGVNTDELAVAALNGTASQGLAGALRAGDRVQLTLTATDSDSPPILLRGVLVLASDRLTDNAYVITFGLSARQNSAFAAVPLKDWRLVRQQVNPAP